MSSRVLDVSLYQLPLNTPVARLDAKKAFLALSEKEKLYAHHLSKASYDGALSTLLQVSPESPLIFVLFQRIFRAQSPDALRDVATSAGLSSDEYDALLVYLAGFISNSGNYKGFGDTKIIPALSVEKLDGLVKASQAYKTEKGTAKLWEEVKGPMFDLSDHRLRLGFGTDKCGQPGLTTYLSSNISKADAELVDRFMAAEKLEAWNTRLFKTMDDGVDHYEIRLAGVDQREVRPAKLFEGAQIRVTTGDYSPLLARCVAHLKEATKHCANDEQTSMLSAYTDHFQTGSLEKHKDGSRHWIRDKGPVVESYIGFIENYRDPAGTRSEFEGFVACVDKATSAKFSNLVERAEELLKRLPWPKEYEKDTFLRPDFTSLDILAFGSSGVPAGINIPNYDEIRQNEGFKNVSLGNVISATPKLKSNFLSDADDEAYKKYFSSAFEVQVGLHELLGHGSGKLFIECKDGSLNYDKDKVKDILSGEPITSCYKEGETWGSKFGALASAYEECRAEAVGYVLCCHKDVLEIFGFKGAEAEEIKYVNWMAEIRAGLMGLEFYSPESKKWGQAHCYARYALTQVSLEAGQGFVKISEMTGADGKPDLLFTLDRTKIDSVGRPATEAFLAKLQLFKSTGDEKRGRELMEKYGTPNEEALRWREVVVARRQPRRIFVMPNTKLVDGKVELVEYPETAGGVVMSNVERYDAGVEEELISLVHKDAHHFRY